MGITTVDLYRCGNSVSPRMHRVRPRNDAVVHIQNGVDWVQGRKKGVSTFSRMTGLNGTWWRLPAGTQYSDLLIVRNDHGHHFAWQPARDMRLIEFQTALAALNGNFLPI